MPTQVRVGGSWLQLAGCKIYATGAWREILAIKVYAGGAWRDVANFSAPPPPPDGGGGGGGSAMTLSVSPSSQLVTGSNSSLTSTGVTATPSGGVAPYTYICTVNEADGVSTINSPSLATTTVTQSGLIISEPVTPSFTYTCTDSLGATASADFTINFRRGS